MTLQHEKSEKEARRSERFRYRCHATVICAEQQYAAHVLNISTGGVLVAIIEEHDIKAGNEATVIIDAGEEHFTLPGQVAHVRSHYIGLRGDRRDEPQHAKVMALLKNAEAGSERDNSPPLGAKAETN